MPVALAIGTLIKLFLLLTPFFVLSVFVTTCSEMSPREQKALAARTTLAVVAATLVLYLFGNLIFTYLGITLDAFRIGAGLVLLLNGIDMVRGSGIPKNRDLGTAVSDPAVVPLAIPTTVGPGTIGTMLVMGAEAGSNVRQRVFEAVAIACAGVLVGVLLYFSRHLKSLLKDKGLSVLTKLTGMYIVALAAQIIFDGINGMFASGCLGEILKSLR
ncbi:MAG: MarC family protein [Lentisphaeria bacterium]|nr:MarC family protein [Lentisphaeria bacterium]